MYASTLLVGTSHDHTEAVHIMASCISMGSHPHSRSQGGSGLYTLLEACVPADCSSSLLSRYGSPTHTTTLIYVTQFCHQSPPKCYLFLDYYVVLFGYLSCVYIFLCSLVYHVKVSTHTSQPNLTYFIKHLRGYTTSPG